METCRPEALKNMSQQHARQSRAVARSSRCSSRRPDTRDIARRMCIDAANAAADSTLSLECWVSWLFGELWRRRGRVLGDSDQSWELVLGTPILDDMAAVGGENVQIALWAIARLDRGELGSYAFELLMRMQDVEPGLGRPEQVDHVGRATITQAAVCEGGEDGEILYVESQCGDEAPHTLAVFVDGQLGWIAKKIGLVTGLDEIREQSREERGGTPFVRREYDLSDPDPMDPAIVCGRLRDALLSTDLLFQPPVGEGYAVLRTLALSRACAVV